MSRQWKHAVVGTGVVGEWHTRLIPKLPTSKLVAVCDVDTARSQSVLAKNNLDGTPIYSDLLKLIKEQKPDVVHVCTPSGLHADPAIAALTAGCHVICEKPMEIELDRIDRMHEASVKSGQRLAGIFQNRWNDANRALRDAAQAGRFGRVAWAGCVTPWHRNDQYYRDGGWRGTWKLDGGGAIMNQSVHNVDLLQWIGGPIKTVAAFGSSRIHAEIEVEDTLSATVQFANGAHGTIMGSTAMWPGGPVRIEIGGELGHAVSDANEGLKTFRFKEELPTDKELVARLGPDRRKESVGGGSASAQIDTDLHYRNITHILSSWEADKDADTFAPEARKAVAIIKALYESMKSGGRPVDVR